MRAIKTTRIRRIMREKIKLMRITPAQPQPLRGQEAVRERLKLIRKITKQTNTMRTIIAIRTSRIMREMGMRSTMWTMGKNQTKENNNNN